MKTYYLILDLTKWYPFTTSLAPPRYWTDDAGNRVFAGDIIYYDSAGIVYTLQDIHIGGIANGRTYPGVLLKLGNTNVSNNFIGSKMYRLLCI